MNQLERWADQVPARAKLIHTRAQWVLREKLEKLPEDPKRYKARLTAGGFTQRPGTDYDIHGTYTLVCSEES